jgi:hypothetical protein
MGRADKWKAAVAQRAALDKKGRERGPPRGPEAIVEWEGASNRRARRAKARARANISPAINHQPPKSPTHER